MRLATEQIQVPDIDGNLALFFKLNDQYKIQGLHGHEIRFAGKIADGENTNVPDILPMHSQDVIEALKQAFAGKSSKVRYSLKAQNEIYHCELHCFPDFGTDNKVINCFLTDRTIEENNSAGLQRKIYELDMINQAVRAFAETRNLSDILRIILLGVTAGSGLGFNRGFILLSNENGSNLRGCLATGPSTPEEAGIIWQNLSKNPLTLEEVLRLVQSRRRRYRRYPGQQAGSFAKDFA